MIIGGLVYVNGNIGIVTDNTFSGSYLVQFVVPDNGYTKKIEQWYEGSVVKDYFISMAEMNLYYTTYPTYLIANMIVYVKDVGEISYVNSDWIMVTVNVPYITPDLFDILGAEFTSKFTNQLNALSDEVDIIKAPIKKSAFIAEADNTNIIDFSDIVGLDLTTAKYEIYYEGHKFGSNNYNINSNLQSIMLTDWVIDTGEIVTLEYTTIK